jgi:hypothetical protein
LTQNTFATPLYLPIHMDHYNLLLQQQWTYRTSLQNCRVISSIHSSNSRTHKQHPENILSVCRTSRTKNKNQKHYKQWYKQAIQQKNKK